MKKSALATALVAMLGVTGAQAAVLNAGDVLTINDGSGVYDAYGNILQVTGGSWFAMDTDGNSRIKNTTTGTEMTPIDGLGGVTIGSTQAAGAIDQWFFFGPMGQDYTTVAPTGGTTAGINLSGWTVFWNNVNVPMGTGAWAPLNASTLGLPTSGYQNGVAFFSWNGTYGSSYVLNYAATVPAGDPSGFGNVKYYLHLEGTVQAAPPAVPVPAAAWLLGSGLVGLVGVARRKAKA